MPSITQCWVRHPTAFSFGVFHARSSCKASCPSRALSPVPQVPLEWAGPWGPAQAGGTRDAAHSRGDIPVCWHLVPPHPACLGTCSRTTRCSHPPPPHQGGASSSLRSRGRTQGAPQHPHCAPEHSVPLRTQELGRSRRAPAAPLHPTGPPPISPGRSQLCSSPGRLCPGGFRTLYS